LNNAIEVEGLKKRYHEHEALRGVDLCVQAGSVLGLLGPNGAGKTTIVRILATLLEPDEGHAKVAGFDVLREAHRVRGRIGLAGQYAAVDELLTGRQNLLLLGRLLHLGRKRVHARAAELLERFGLTDAADRSLATYSGGMRRRLDLAACLIASPSVLFLDEPTTGLDPASRRSLWAMVRELVSDGVTVLLTTQYLDEADHLADRIVVVAEGRVVAEGSPDQLKRKVGEEWLEVSVALPSELGTAIAALSAVGQARVDEHRATIALQVGDGIGGIARAAAALSAANVDVADFALRRPTLDDVFLSLTGHPPGSAPPGG
jgi:ABC-2 type transport system ATP-binding protein